MKILFSNCGLSLQKFSDVLRLPEIPVTTLTDIYDKIFE